MLTSANDRERLRTLAARYAKIATSIVEYSSIWADAGKVA